MRFTRRKIFLANRNFTFKSDEAHVRAQLSKYLVLPLVNYLLTILIGRFVVEKIRLTAYHGVLASVFFIMIVGYVLSNFWVLKKVRAHG
jgi:putative flippase GtrA